MNWSDEWWKGKYGQRPATPCAVGEACPDPSPGTHGACGFPAAHPDGFANEEWWGLVRVRVDSDPSQPDLVEPREAYRVLEHLWRLETLR
jgi:hypothetical protein